MACTNSLVVLKCYCLWSWLSRHDPPDKRLYPVRELLAPERFHYCTLCEHSRPTIYGNPDCSECLMYDRWPSVISPILPTVYCIGPYSQYRHWSWADTPIEEKHIAAGNIAQALWELYKELEER